MNAKPTFQESLARVKEWIRKPGVILLAALVIAFSAIALLIGNTLFPIIKEEAVVRLKYAELERKLNELEKKPLPVRVDPAAIRKLAERVPLADSMPEFMEALQDLESESGVVIKSLTMADAQQQNADLVTEYIQELQKARGSSSESEENSKTKAEEGLQMVTPIRLMLTVQGSYDQVLSMLGGIQSLERIAAIDSWILQENPEPRENLSAEFEPLQMSMRITIYQAAGYKDKFPEMPQPEMLPPAQKRQDPMIGEERFLDMLRQSSTMQ